jgi:hypothetical protein
MGTGTVVGRFGTSDEAFVLAGRLTITFTPNVDYVVDRTSTPKMTLMLFDTTCGVDIDGYLIDDTGSRSVTLPATDDTDLDPYDWGYKVTTELAGGTTPFPVFYIAVPEGTTVDLSTVMPSTFSAGVASVSAAVAAEAAAAASAAVALAAARVTLSYVALYPEEMFTGSPTLNGDGAVVASAVRWPDGTTGNYTATADASWPGTIASYAVTYGSPVTLTFTQPTVTRDGTGTVTTTPAIVVS